MNIIDDMHDLIIELEAVYNVLERENDKSAIIDREFIADWIEALREIIYKLESGEQVDMREVGGLLDIIIDGLDDIKMRWEIYN